MQKSRTLFVSRFLSFTSALVFTTATDAQIVNDGRTNTLNNVTSNITGTVTVGTNGSFTLLILTNSALLTNSGHGIIGRNAGAKSNAVRLTGANTRWFMGNNLYVGSNGAFSQVVVSNGARLMNANAHLGFRPGSSNNVAVVTGAGSVWSNRSELDIGFESDGNRLTASSGGVILDDMAIVGTGGNSNQALVTGTGTVWTNHTDLWVGAPGNGNLLVLSNGARIFDHNGIIGMAKNSLNNEAVVTGAGSLWSNRQQLVVGLFGDQSRLTVRDGGTVIASTNVSVGINGVNNFLLLSSGALLSNNGNGIIGVESSAHSNTVFITGTNTRWFVGNNLYVGSNGAFSQVVVSNAGLLTVTGSAVLGFSPGSTNNRLVVQGGTLRSTNVANTGLLDVRRGTNVLNAGLMELDRLLVTNTLGNFEFNGGTLVTESTTNNNGRVFAVGNGASAATLNLAGNGTHSFANGLTVRPNATILGNGNIIGTLTVQSGGSVSPGTSVGRLSLNSAPVLQGVLLMEISKSGSVLTNDVLQTAGSVTYGGALTVTKLGADALTAGNRFRLFSATSYGGAFSVTTLPALGAGLAWTNKLGLDGSIEVVGAAAPQFGNIALSGTNVIIRGIGGPTNGTYWVLASTNVALPLSNWTRLLTNQFNSVGAFVFTNGRSPTLPRRFYVLQVP